MNDFKIRGKCSACRKPKWFVRKRQIKLPMGQTATSKELICSQCFNPTKKHFK